MSLNKEWVGKDNITYVKLRTNENMIYTVSKLPWSELADNPESEGYETMEEYVHCVTSRIMRNVIEKSTNATGDLLYLYEENRVVNKNDIKEMFVETQKPIVKK